MTEIVNSHISSREFSRRSFVKGGGAMIVGFSLAAAGLAGKAQAAESPFASNAPYDPLLIDSFLAIHADNTATVKSGKVELGQGLSTGLLMIAAEELDMNLSQLKWIDVDTNVTPDTGGTYGSNGVTQGGPPVRAAAAYAKQALLGMAATQLGVPVSSLTVSGGVVAGGGRSVTYGALIGDKLFNIRRPVQNLNPGVAPAKEPSSYKVVTTSPPRIDIPDKVRGTYPYVYNVRIPGMLHARIVRPRGQGAYGTGAKPLSVDASSIKHIRGAQVVRRGDFLAVVAPKEYDAILAAAQLKVKWEEVPILPSSGSVYSMMRKQDAAGQTVQRLTTTGNVNTALASASKVLSASYTYDYQGHMPIGPTCLLADVQSNGALIITSSQDSYVARPRVAAVLGLPANVVRFKYYEGGSCFGGHPGRYDAPPAAAVISQAVGKPVRLQYMRWDEHGWDAYGPSLLADVRAGIDASGKLVGYDNTHWTMPGAGMARIRETTEELVGQGPLSAAQIPISNANTGPSGYTIPNRRGLGKAVPMVNGGYLKQAPMRDPGSPNNFPAEVMIDELAYAARMDPIAFRILNASSQRTVDSLVTLQQTSKWEARVAASKLSNAAVVRGRGMALANPGGVAVEIEVDKKTGRITVLHMDGVMDVGLAISPGLVENQMVGTMIQTAGRALYEGVRYSKTRQTSLDWVSYPILRFKEHPSLTTVVMQRINEPSTGAGEPLVPGIPAAIANAFFDATGVRIRQVPMTPAVVRAVLKAGGSATAGVN
jgi:CO/xanthine dehydrogenase Mo-binding subunit